MKTKVYILIAFVLCTSGEDCADYERVSDSRRSVQQVFDEISDFPICDTQLDENKWYRFDSEAGDKIPERNPPETVAINHCGTEVPMYIKGRNSHPLVDGLTFEARVCANFGEGGNNCNWEGDIKIHKCPAVNTKSTFYIYKLVQPPGCSLAYCAGEGTPCPRGEMWNGSNCTNKFPAMSGFPTFSGPHTIGNGKAKQIYFSCTIKYQPIDGNDYARFDITFLFDGTAMQIASSPFKDILQSFTIDPKVDNYTVHLEEQYLRGRLGKEISCQAVSYWLGYRTQSEPMISKERYWAGIASSQSSYDIDISKGSWFPIVFNSTLPLTCHHCVIYKCECSYRFLVYSDALALECSMIWSEKQSQPQIQAYVVPTALGAISMQFQVQIQKYTGDAKQKNSSLWHDYRIPPAQISVYNSLDQTGLVYLNCSSVGDPHIMTFDRYYFDNYLIGDFVLVSAIDPAAELQMEVQVRHEVCFERVSCICGVIVRERNSVFKVSRCEGGVNQPISAVQLLKQYPDDGSRLFRDATGTHFSVRFPSGLRVEIGAEAQWFDVFVYIPKMYHGRTSKFTFCGDSNGNGSDDALANPNNFRTPESRNFFRRQPDCSTLFYPAAINCKCNNVSTLKCSNVDKNIAKASTANIEASNIATSGHTCFAPTKAGDLELESATFIDTDSNSDLIVDESQLFSTPNFDPDFGRNVSFSWPTPKGKTEIEAEDHCRNALNKSPAKFTCSILGDTRNLLLQCKRDIQIADEFLNVESYARAMDHKCLNVLISTDDKDTLATVDAVYNSVCLNYCSGHGTCTLGKCTCNKGFIGADCSVEKNQPPTLTGIGFNGLCDIRARPCITLSVFGANIASDSNLMCRFQDGANGSVVETSGTFMTQKEVRCSQNETSSTHRQKRSADKANSVKRTLISIANDGILYSNQVEFVTYDSYCVSCNTQGCFPKENMCLINDNCYENGFFNEASCEQCILTQSSSSWTSRIVLEYTNCSRTCDYGVRYIHSVCSINEHVISTKGELCMESPCPAIQEEKAQGVILEWNKDELIKVLPTPSLLFDEVARAVNTYCSSNAAQCCRSAGVPGGSNISDYTSPGQCDIGSGYPEVGETTGRLKIIVKIDLNAVQQRCLESEISATPNNVYADLRIIYDAILASKLHIEEAFNITLLRVSMGNQ